MRLTSISALNYQSHRGLNLQINPDARVILIAGGNGAGKTAIAEGIELALTGQPVRGLQFKNELNALVTQGESKGEFIVGATSGGSPGEWSISLKNGAHDGGELDGSTLSINPRTFMALSPVDRRKQLFAMAGLKVTTDSIRATLISRGHAEERVDAVIHHVRAGFDRGAEQARTKASEARGAWKAITGENYGTAKAPDWAAPIGKTEVTASPEAIQKTIDSLSDGVREAETAVQALREASAVWKTAEPARAAKEALKENRALLRDAIDRRESAKLHLENLERCAAHSGGETAPCPACGVVLFWNQKGELREHEKAKPDTDPVKAHRAISAARAEFDEVAAEAAALEKKVIAGQNADEILNGLPEKPAPDALTAAEARLARVRGDLEFAKGDLQIANKAANAAAEAARITAQALAEHQNVEAYTALADALQNLPGEYLKTTLGRVNDLMQAAGSAFGKPVVLGEDMVPRFGTVPYGLASRSQQWRILAALGYALAVMGGLNFTILDEFDLVEPARRGDILKWLSNQTEVQVVLCATLKAKPVLPEPPFQIIWLS